MTELITRVAKLTPYAKRPKTLPGHIRAFTFEPPTTGKSYPGCLIIVLEVLGTSKQSAELADLIIENTGHHFYNTKVEPSNDSVQSHFSSTIKAVNDSLATYADSGHASWIGKLSACICVSTGDKLWLSMTGSIIGTLLRDNKTISLSNTDDQLNQDSNKVFSTITEGELQTSDKLLFATPALSQCVESGQLQQILTDHNPSSAAQALKNAINGHLQAERVAVVVAEITNVDLLSMQHLPDSSDSIELGAPKNTLESIKLNTRPYTKKIWHFLKTKYNQTSRQFKHKLLPKLGRCLTLIMRGIFKGLINKSYRRYLYIAIIIILIGGLFWRNNNLQSAALQNLATKYNQAFSDEQQAEVLIQKGNYKLAVQKLTANIVSIQNIIQSPLANKLDQRLKISLLPPKDPKSVHGLLDLTQKNLDIANRVIHVKPIAIANLSSSNLGDSSMMEIIAGKLLIVDPKHMSIGIYDLASAKIKVGVTSRDIADVVAVTTSINDNGLILITSKPSVLLYRVDDNSLTPLNISFGVWPSSKSIAAFNSNLYILPDGNSQINKFSRTLTGFSAKTNYLPNSEVVNIDSSTAIAVDGALYVASSRGLKRYVAGVLKQNLVELPASLSQIKSLHSYNEGATITMTSSQNRIGIISLENQALIYKKQFALDGIISLKDDVIESKSNSLYILADGHLWRVSL